MLHIYLNLSFSELHSAINKLIKTVMDTELSLENTLKADESTSWLATSELGLFLKYLNPVTNTLRQVLVSSSISKIQESQCFTQSNCKGVL